MQQPDTSIYQAWMKGDSVGSLAKRYKLDKSQIKRIINRVSSEAKLSGAEVLHELQDEEASSGRSVQSV